MAPLHNDLNPPAYSPLQMLPNGEWQYLNGNTTWIGIAFSHAVMPTVPIWENPAIKLRDFYFWSFGVIMLVVVGIYLGYKVVKFIRKVYRKIDWELVRQMGKTTEQALSMLFCGRRRRNGTV